MSLANIEGSMYDSLHCVLSYINLTDLYNIAQTSRSLGHLAYLELVKRFSPDIYIFTSENNYDSIKYIEWRCGIIPYIPRLFRYDHAIAWIMTGFRFDTTTEKIDEAFKRLQRIKDYSYVHFRGYGVYLNNDELMTSADDFLGIFFPPTQKILYRITHFCHFKRYNAGRLNSHVTTLSDIQTDRRYHAFFIIIYNPYPKETDYPESIYHRINNRYIRGSYSMCMIENSEFAYHLNELSIVENVHPTEDAVYPFFGMSIAGPNFKSYSYSIDCRLSVESIKELLEKIQREIQLSVKALGMFFGIHGPFNYEMIRIIKRLFPSLELVTFLTSFEQFVVAINSTTRDDEGNFDRKPSYAFIILDYNAR